MVMRGRELKGWVYVQEDAMRSQRDFDSWIGMALDFNKRAKASPREKKKTATKKVTAKKKPKSKAIKKTARKKK